MSRRDFTKKAKKLEEIDIPQLVAASMYLDEDKAIDRAKIPVCMYLEYSPT